LEKVCGVEFVRFRAWLSGVPLLLPEIMPERFFHCHVSHIKNAVADYQKFLHSPNFHRWKQAQSLKGYPNTKKRKETLYSLFFPLAKIRLFCNRDYQSFPEAPERKGRKAFRRLSGNSLFERNKT